jgi:hypothetical protein
LRLAPLFTLSLLRIVAAGCGGHEMDPGDLGGSGFLPAGGQLGMSRGGKALGVIAPVPDPLGPGGANPPPPSQTGAARVKFCHHLTYKKMPVQLELLIGGQRLSAMTGGCSSGPGQMCMVLPTGPQTLSLVHEGRTIATTRYELRAGGEYGVFAGVDEQGVYLGGGRIGVGLTCAAASIDDVTDLGESAPPPTPTMPPPTPTMPPPTPTMPAVPPPAKPPAPPSTPPTGTMAMCGGQTATTSCGRCTYNRCCDEMEACLNDPDCVGLDRCLVECEDDGDCIDACYEEFPEGEDLSDAYEECVEARCEPACGNTVPAVAPPATSPPTSPPVSPTPPTTQPPVTPPAAGRATIKFCNKLTRGGAPFTMELELGGITLRAATGQCTPMPGTACSAVPTGAQVLIVRDLSRNAVVVNAAHTVQPGSNTIFVATLKDTGGETIRTAPMPTAAACAAVAYSDLP